AAWTRWADQAGSRYEVVILDAATGKEHCQFTVPAEDRPFGFGVGACFSPDGKTLALSRPAAGKIEWYDLATQTVRHTLAIAVQVGPGGGGKGLGRPPNLLLFSPDGSVFAASADSTTLGVWDAATGQRLGSVPIPETMNGDAEFSPDGRCLVLGM